MYFYFGIGKTFSSNAARCAQVIDAYSVMSPKLFAETSAMSGNDMGLVASAAVTVLHDGVVDRMHGRQGAGAASAASNKAVAQARHLRQPHTSL